MKAETEKKTEIDIFRGKITKNVIEVTAKVIFTVFAFVAVAAIDVRMT